MKDKKNRVEKSLKLLVKSSFIVLIGIFFSKLFSYLYRIVIARSFGAEIYGLFTLALMISGFFIMLFSLGLNDGLLRYISFYRGRKEYSKANYLFKNFSFVLLISSIIGGIILFILSETIAIRFFHNQQLTIFLKFFSIGLPFTILAGTYLYTLQAFEKIVANSFINNILSSELKFLLLIIFIVIGIKSNAVIFSYLLSVVIVFVISCLFSRYSLPILFKKYSLEKKIKTNLSKEIFSYSWPFIFLGAIYTLFNWTDSFVIGYFMDARNVGFYNAAFTLIALFSIAPQLFEKLFFPYIIKEYSKKKITMVKELSKQVSKWIFILNLPLFLIMFVFPGALLNQIFGGEFLVAESSLKILAVGGFLASLTSLFNNLLSMKGKTKIILINTIIISLLDLILNIILVPRYGLNGAALSTAFSLALLNVMLFIEVKYYTSIIPLRKKLINVFIVGLISLLFLSFIKGFFPLTFSGLILVGILFSLFYVAFIFLTKCFDKYDLSIIKSLKYKLLPYLGIGQTQQND